MCMKTVVSAVKAAWAGAIKGKCRSSRVSVRPSNERTCPVSTTALCICSLRAAPWQWSVADTVADQSVRILHRSFLRFTGHIFAFDWKTTFCISYHYHYIAITICISYQTLTLRWDHESLVKLDLSADWIWIFFRVRHLFCVFVCEKHF